MSTADNHPIRLLVSAAASPAATSLVAHWRQAGFYVIGIDANPDASALGEAICDEFHLCPLAYSEDYPAFILPLLAKVDVFVPFIDEELEYFSGSSFPEQLRAKVMMSPRWTMHICLNKEEFQHFCEQHSLPIASLASGPPAVWKPVYGRGAKGVVNIVDDCLFSYYAQRSDGVLQTLLTGIEYTVDCLLLNSGDLHTAVSRRRILSAGVSTIGRIDQNPEVLALAERVVSAMSFRGLINVQVMLTDAGAFLIEVNPRIAGSIIFTVLAGADLPVAAVTHWLTGSVPAPMMVQDRVIYRYWSEFSVLA